jgi:hypothetical protein
VPVIDCSKLEVGEVNPNFAQFEKNKQYNLGAGTYTVAPGGIPSLESATDVLCIKVGRNGLRTSLATVWQFRL